MGILLCAKMTVQRKTTYKQNTNGYHSILVHTNLSINIKRLSSYLAISTNSKVYLSLYRSQSVHISLPPSLPPSLYIYIYIYILSVKSISPPPKKCFCPVGWGSRIHRQLLYSGIRPTHNECLGINLYNLIARFQ